MILQKYFTKAGGAGTMKLFLDDIRREPEGYVLVRSFEDCIFELGTKAVSYTHLDVYKRQVKWLRTFFRFF